MREGHKLQSIVLVLLRTSTLGLAAGLATMQKRRAAGLGRRGRWASRSRARPVRWLHVRPALVRMHTMRAADRVAVLLVVSISAIAPAGPGSSDDRGR